MLWQPDIAATGLISFQLVGLVFFSSAYLLILIIVGTRLIKKFDWEQTLILVASLLFLALFLLPTRVHERHLFSALPFLALSAYLVVGFAIVYAYFSFVLISRS